jgi:hypothetical protein
MNLRAKCVNKECRAFGIEKSVMVGQLAGYGAPNDRIICPVCGQLMRTTRSINVSAGKGMRKLVRRVMGWRPTSSRNSKRTTKRVYKRGGGKRC